MATRKADDVPIDNDDMPVAKRQAVAASILDICMGKSTNIFEGDVLVLYGPASMTTSTSPPKAQVLHADLVDTHGQFTITVNISDRLISQFRPHFFAGNSVRITGFKIIKKSKYERGDASHCISLTPTSTVENIPLVCGNHRLTSDTTIATLLDSNDDYPVGSFAAIVTGFRLYSRQCEIYVKDGQNPHDTATVHLNERFKESYSKMQQILASGKLPMFLFKNMVRNGPKGSRNIRTGLSSFLQPLNDDCAKAYLQGLAETNVQVTGVLKPADVFLPPFKPSCNYCKHVPLSLEFSTDDMFFCTRCLGKTSFSYVHTLECTIHKEDEKINCTLPNRLLQQFLPNLAQISFDDYKKNISQTVFLLRGFSIDGTFSIAMDNTIADVKKN